MTSALLTIVITLKDQKCFVVHLEVKSVALDLW